MSTHEHSRRAFLAASAAGLTAGLTGCGGAEPEGAPAPDPRAAVPDQPNIVLIILDTLRADKLGCYGYPAEVSPGLDQLANQGVRFARTVSQCPWTRPSCGSFLTSLYPRTLGLYKERNEILPSNFETLPMILKKAGYSTYGATANPNLNTAYNFHHGFDAYSDSSVVFGWMKDQQPGKTTRTRQQRLPYASDLFAGALDWAGKLESGPGYIQLNAMEIHEWLISNTLVRDEYQTMFTDVGERYPRYVQSVRQLTDDTAEFIHTLSQVPGWENTLFVMLSDHGEGLGDHGGIAHDKVHGWLLYESAVCVPWVMYHPRWKPAQSIVPQSVRLLEVAPTLLDIAGVPIPGSMVGRSMLPVITGEQPAVELPEYLITETQWRDANKLGAYASDWKFYDNRDQQKGLPRHELQPQGGGEMGIRTDASEENPEVTAEMLAYVREWDEAHPKTAPTPHGKELTEEEIRQLESMGYFD